MPVPADQIAGQHAKPPPPPNIVGGEERYEVEEVIDSHIYRRKLQHLVRWKCYRHEENLWLAEGDIDTPELIMEFYRAHPNTPKHISTLAFRQLGFRLCHVPQSGRKGPTLWDAAP